uniref:Uncharacterized protein n=1 Tax=Arcella intermedia TaxID=1963864 RepID=A0A6B2L362_9EUKA
MSWSSCWLGNTYPIFFYAGNEADITLFWGNSGFIFELAATRNALVVFGEHRYYGQSLPFGAQSWQPRNIPFLSSEQTLADYAVLLAHLKEALRCPDSRVVVFGGSYGGMLAFYMRLKYPHLVDAALASSAPIGTVGGGGREEPPFYQTVTGDFNAVSPLCPAIVRDAFVQIHNLSSTTSGRALLALKLQTCAVPEATDIEQLVQWLTHGLSTMAMVDYPYPTSFQGALPAWPVNASCEILQKGAAPGIDSLANIGQAVGLLYNGSGELPCFDIYQEYTICSIPTGCGGGQDGLSWDYQVCTEFGFFTQTDFVHDMFPPAVWNLGNLTQYCKDKWGVAPDLRRTEVEYGGREVGASRVVFSNGVLDPWKGGGVYGNVTEREVWSIVIEGGAHHLDLRGSDERDPESVVRARAFEAEWIARWTASGFGKDKEMKYSWPWYKFQIGSAT